MLYVGETAEYFLQGRLLLAPDAGHVRGLHTPGGQCPIEPFMLGDSPQYVLCDDELLITPDDGAIGGVSQEGGGEAEVTSVLSGEVGGDVYQDLAGELR